MDTNFAGDWKDGDHDCSESVLSETGFLIVFAGCPFTLDSKLQIEIALSTTGNEYIALVTAMGRLSPPWTL